MDSRNNSNHEGLNITSERFLGSGNYNLSFGLLGFIMNGFICFIIAFHDSLRQPFNHLILNLAVSDSLLSLALILNSVINYMAAATINQLSNISKVANIACKFIMFCAITSFSSTCLTLFAISIERYQCISTKRRHMMKLSTTQKAIVLIWLFTSLSSIIMAYFGEIHKANYNCNLVKINELWLIIIFIILTILTVALPILLMLLLYTYIIFKLFRKIQVSGLNSTNIIKAQKHLRRNLIVVVIISMLACSSGLPYISLNIMAVIGEYVNPNFRQVFLDRYEILWNFASVSFIAAPTINPLLYNFANRQFRNIILQYIAHLYCCSWKSKRQNAIHV